MNPEQTIIHDFVTDCNIVDPEAQWIVLEILGSLDDINVSITPVSLQAELKLQCNLPANAGRMILTAVQMLRDLINMTLWVKDMSRINFPMAVGDFDIPLGAKAQTRHGDCIQRIAASARVDRSLFPTFPKHPAMKFESWTHSAFNYFTEIMGRNGVPLTYLLRPDDAPAVSALIPTNAGYTTCAKMARLCCTIDDGDHCTFDKDKLYSELISRLKSTAAMDWLPHNHERTRDGQAAYLALATHYAHVESSAVKLAKAKKMESTLHNKDEKARSFELVMGDAQNCFRMFEDAGVPQAAIACFCILVNLITGVPLFSPALGFALPRRSDNPTALR